jgi:glutamine synthetase
MPFMTSAPIYSGYGINNRSVMLRIARSRPAVENRVPDSSCDIYLAAAPHLAAGLEGIEKGPDAGEPVNKDAYKLT